ncbi:MAG: ATP-dependent zinc metalloprotease FtsH [Alphaproteobacteria bacterium]|nr:ATP-dependent zinc metalloprotease FtsH [Alphaproteobacteria bacterium]
MRSFVVFLTILYATSALRSSRLFMKIPDNVLRNKYLYSELSYNSLIKNIENHKVKSLYFGDRMDTVIAEDSELHENSVEDYTITKITPLVTNSLVDLSVKNEVNTVFSQPPQPNIYQQMAGNILNGAEMFLLPGIILSVIISFFRVNSQMRNPSSFLGSGMPNDLNKDKINMQQANVSLASFAGSPEIFQECAEVVSYLKNSTLYEQAGAEIPRGILLEGSPGTGKTLLAKAIASEAEANFISIAASEFVEIFVGMGASKIRNLFKTARENKPCIIFIDEIDAVGRQRGAGINMANDEREQTLNQLLAEMDGFADNKGILIMGATNRRDVLDAALLRPGRFDRIINVPLPDVESRVKILKVHTKNKMLDDSVNLSLIAELTGGFSGAQLKNLMNEAAILCARDGNTVITEKIILEALDKLLVGIVKKVDTRDDEAKRRVAIHETGHALLAAIYNNYFDLKKVSIQSTYSGAGGYTVFNEYRNVTESGLYTKDLLFKRLMVGMGGKAAENIFYGDDHVSVGAVQDLKQTNSLAQRMIGNYGMGLKMEVFYNDEVDNDRNPFLGRSLSMGAKYSEHTKEIFDKESLNLVKSAYAEAKTILTENKEFMDIIIQKLLENSILLGSDVNNIINNNTRINNIN